MNGGGYPICDARVFFGSQPSLREWQKKNSVGAWCLNGKVMHWMVVARYFDEEQPSMPQLYGILEGHIDRFNDWAEERRLGCVEYPPRHRFDRRARDLASWIEERSAETGQLDMQKARALLSRER
ncbi:hypothetical protein [Pararhizobium sp. A13]|uniref:hypothetical protein n=1 Tax=Pararhizobium sp. A13 TaxID=3133975 RepID=UPI003251BED0